MIICYTHIGQKTEKNIQPAHISIPVDNDYILKKVFSDEDNISNQEAVIVLVRLGIVDGMGDGAF